MTRELPPIDESVAAHVRLAPSSAYRWSLCPGSAVDGLDDEETAAAAEGTLAHARASAYLLDQDVSEAVALQLATLDTEAFDEMTAGILKYVDYCRGIPGVAYIERKVMSGYIPEHGGTMDYAVDNPEFLHVVDFKFGTMQVRAKNNAQLKSYLRLLREYLGKRPRYFGTIVQPRVSDDPDTWEFSDADLDEWELTVIEASQDDRLNAGEHCKWCPLLAKCQTAFDHAKQLADEEFTIVDEVTPALIERFNQVLAFEGVIGRMAELAKEKMLECIRYGAEIPGWKAAMSLGHRAWKDPETLPETIAARYKEKTNNEIESGLIYNPIELKSPAQLEKVLPKDMFADLWAKPERGVCVVPRDSKLQEFDFDHFGVIENES